MDMRPILISNGTGIVILLILLYVSRARTSRRGFEDRLFNGMVFGVMLGCAMEALSYAIDGMTFPGSIVINYIANTYLYCANLLLPFCVLVYVDVGLYGDTSRIWKKYKLQIIIGAVMIGLNVVNYIVPITYYISDQNVYERRPLSYVYYVVILYYLITAFVLTIRYERENGARSFFRIALFIIPILLGAGLQFAFYGLSLAWLASAIGLAGLFMMQQNELAYIDALVDTYNRQYLNHVLTAWMSRQKNFVGVMLDIDSFKSINDRFGHTQGDASLRDLTDVLKKSRAGGEKVFRYAGDEFIVLKLADSPDGLAEFLNSAEANLDEYNRNHPDCPLSISYGTSYFDKSDMDAFIKEMDDGMYEMKARHHAAAAAAAAMADGQASGQAQSQDPGTDPTQGSA